VAPFHLLEGRGHTDEHHTWRMDTRATVCRADPELLLATAYKLVDVTDPASQDEGAGGGPSLPGGAARAWSSSRWTSSCGAGGASPSPP
jgi:hypothetical protein